MSRHVLLELRYLSPKLLFPYKNNEHYFNSHHFNVSSFSHPNLFFAGSPQNSLLYPQKLWLAICLFTSGFFCGPQLLILTFRFYYLPKIPFKKLLITPHAQFTATVGCRSKEVNSVPTMTIKAGNSSVICALSRRHQLLQLGSRDEASLISISIYLIPA